MSREKNIFEKFPKKWPKGSFGKPVRGERGNHDLPSGAKGGEKMDLDRHDEHKQHTFDSFCKKVIRCEAYNAYRAIGRRQDLEIPFSQLLEEAMEALAAWDVYPWKYTSFPVDGDVILIKDDRLADALTALPQRFRDILLMYWFLELADREIGERLSLSRKTVNNRRQQAYELLRKLMGGDANERRNARSSLIPYPVIAAAVRGDPEAVNQVLDHYSGYIAALSMRRGYDQNGNPCLAVDEEIRRRIETKLIVAILSFDLN